MHDGVRVGVRVRAEARSSRALLLRFPGRGPAVYSTFDREQEPEGRVQARIRGRRESCVSHVSTDDKATVLTVYT